MKELKELNINVGFIGAGNMASALISGLVEGGFRPTHLLVTDLDASKARKLADALKVQALSSARAIVERSDVVILAIKPHGVPTLLQELADLSSKCLWISVAAGVPTPALETALNPGARVVRAMPNTPALVGEGASGICGGQHASNEDLSLTRLLLGAVGICETVNESMMDALTGVSGSGPAYVMLMIEAMADGGVYCGLPRPVALRLAAQTLKGAATLMLETGKHPAELKDMVTSPGGTTIAGVAALEKAGIRNALISAVSAAARRSKELQPPNAT